MFTNIIVKMDSLKTQPVIIDIVDKTNLENSIRNTNDISITNSMSNKDDSKEIKTKSKSKKRCCFPDCNKKLKMTDVTCRCENTYCAIHRLPENHQCQFDYISMGKGQLNKILPKVVSSKVEKI
jgi:hypothetical protein